MIDPFWSMLMHGAASAMVRKTALSAQLVALHAEANEAKHHEAGRDWLRDQASRAEEMRESRRADPATLMVAHWLGTTEARLNLLQDFACVVVLEGTACFAWYFAGLGGLAPSRAAVVFDRNATVPQQEAVAPVTRAMRAGRVEQSPTQVATVAEEEPIESDSTRGPVMSNDDWLLAEIHEAVLAGRLKRNLIAICEFVGLRKPTPAFK
ncbi:hypothetical protein [Burkholderia sp. S171]|uniref:hypothetical protein n=1 Tax=Burkholderia sp. S171 TaxID=1641860 RepID=UPI00131C3F73|nr:hypothetical protein [Burkholderia sp. S171]